MGKLRTEVPLRIEQRPAGKKCGAVGVHADGARSERWREDPVDDLDLPGADAIADERLIGRRSRRRLLRSRSAERRWIGGFRQDDDGLAITGNTAGSPGDGWRKN